MTPLTAIPATMLLVLIPLMIWDAVWKFIGLWKSARHNQIAWFVCIAIFNTVGILPIVYILFFQKGRNPVAVKTTGKGRKR